MKQFNHPVVGKIELHYDTVALPGDTELALTVYTAEPGSVSEDALRMLASWAATGTDEPAELEQRDHRSA